MHDTMIPPVIMLLTGPVQNMVNRKIMAKELLEEHTNVNIRTLTWKLKDDKPEMKWTSVDHLSLLELVCPPIIFYQ